MHVVALRSNGSIEVSLLDGSNEFAQVGMLEEELAVLSSPPDISDGIAIASSDRHSLVLRSDGTVLAWGNNAWGRCDVPAGLNDVVAISAGGSYSAALKSDGSIVVWGDGSDGSPLNDVIEQEYARVYGCIDQNAFNFNPLATADDPNSCIDVISGCTNILYEEFNQLANTMDEQSCMTLIPGAEFSNQNNIDS